MPLFLWELKTVSGVNWFDSDGREYSQFRPRYSDALLKWVASTAKEHGVLWDCATGNGQAAVGLARYFKQVIATDSASSQIEAAEVLSNIEYRQADAACSGLSACSVDCVTIAQAMHWFAYDDFFAEVKRVAKPVRVWLRGVIPPVFTDPQIQALWQRCYIDYLQRILSRAGVMLKTVMPVFRSLFLQFKRVFLDKLIVGHWRVFSLCVDIFSG